MKIHSISSYSQRKRIFWVMNAALKNKGSAIGIIVIIGIIFLLYSLGGEHFTGHVQTNGRHRTIGCLKCAGHDDMALYRLRGNNSFSTKINRNGEYLPYLGYSIISKLDPKTAEGIGKLLANSLHISKYVSFLPPKALFIEVSTIFDHDRSRSLDQIMWSVPAWVPQDVSEGRFLPMKGDVLDVMTRGDDACVRHGRGFTGAFEGIRSSHQPGFPVHVPVRALDDYWITKIKENTNRIFHIKDRRSKFDMKLGYMFKKFPDDLTEWRLIQEDVSAIKEYLLGLEAPFMAPRVYVFSDMTCYVPLKDYLGVCEEA